MDLKIDKFTSMFSSKNIKPIVLHAITDRPDVYEFSKVNHANKFYPKWISNLESTYEGALTDFKNPFFSINNINTVSTIKKCIAINNLYSSGIIIPMWTDFVIDVGDQNSNNIFYKFSDEKTGLMIHHPDQFGNALPNNIFHIKIESPWLFHCDQDIKFMWSEPTWSLNLDSFNNFKILPGLIDFKYQSNTAINLFLRKKDEVYRAKINFNEPLVHLIPLSDNRIDIKYHLLPKEEFLAFRESKGGSQQTFINRYKMNKSHFKTSKCPFLHKEYLK